MVLNAKQRMYILNQFVKRHDRESGERTINLDKNDSLTIEIDRGVLGSDLMIPAMYLAKFIYQHTELYKNKKVLDMGCGAGPQGIICAMNGAVQVDFSDISKQAVENCKRNLGKFNIINSAVYEGDLFEPIPKNQYDVIIFNNPFFPEGAEAFEEYPLNDLLREGILGGTELLKRFYLESKRYLKEDGIIIQPYFHLAGEENNPANRAKEYGFEVEEHKITSEDGLQMKDQSIYVLSCVALADKV